MRPAAQLTRLTAETCGGDNGVMHGLPTGIQTGSLVGLAVQQCAAAAQPA